MSQLVKGLSHVLSNCYRNNSPEKAVSASQILEYYETKCASVHIFSIRKLVLWNSFKNHLLHVDLLIIPMMERPLQHLWSRQCSQCMGVNFILLRQHEQGSWSSQEHFSEIVPKEPLGTVFIIPCWSINKAIF